MGIRASIYEGAASTTVTDYNIREVCLSPKDAGAWVSGVENTTSNTIP